MNGVNTHKADLPEAARLGEAESTWQSLDETARDLDWLAEFR